MFFVEKISFCYYYKSLWRGMRDHSNLREPSSRTSLSSFLFLSFRAERGI